MATPPDSPIIEEATFIELEEQLNNPSVFQHARPVALDDLCRQTKFTRQEIRIMYRGFKQKCPEGVVHEDLFKDIYSKFFPHGNSNLYAHFVFKAFDVKSNGAISFKDMLMTLSTLLRGSIYEKLRWTFKLYDLNGDGCITRSELGQIVLAIHELMGKRPQIPSCVASCVKMFYCTMQSNQWLYSWRWSVTGTYAPIWVVEPLNPKIKPIWFSKNLISIKMA
ncbi:Kv channel-interacting protein 4 isoform X1 [Sipha flava]|uniref:Kv channel-interacting protein 4 isoform X1 n=1 Tax=Sipha flava TaxID=143950 RepID=A0A8B8GIP2_9HEMI|nr:Kv channel-interacting protein 4 isoform X1 [Sipha flava]XP_025422785.1 Kv channel-interacting protein 4 isoform X1 [Sipha flava]